MSMGHHRPQANASKLPSAQQKSRPATDQAKSEMVDITSRTWASPFFDSCPCYFPAMTSKKTGEPLCDSNRGTTAGFQGAADAYTMSVPFIQLKGPSEAPGCWLPWGQPGVWLGVVPPSLGDPGAALGGWPPPTLWRRLGKLPNGASVPKPTGGMPPSALQKLLQLSSLNRHSAPRASPQTF